MVRRAPMVLAFGPALLLLLAPATIRAQTLAARPGIFADPIPGKAPSHGELILGRTTLAGAQRIFAVELSSDSITVARGHHGNPAPLPASTRWEVGGASGPPRFRLDLGPQYYTLYFDSNHRLVAALTRHLPRPVTGVELAARYPSLQTHRKWRSGDVGFKSMSVATSTCVMLSAHVRSTNDRVEQLGYIYTCPTSTTSPGK